MKKNYSVSIQFGGHLDEDTLNNFNCTEEDAKKYAQIAFDYHSTFGHLLFSGISVTEIDTVEEILFIGK